MSNALDHVAYLSQEIGPHPAGTEEEQQAALYIADTINQNTHMTAIIEDFNGSAGPARAKLICSVIAVLCAVLSLFVQLLTVPCLVLSVVAAVLYVLEWIGRPFLSRFAKKNISQNVVAKHEPAFTGEAAARRRKVVLVARYDSGKVRSELKGGLVNRMGYVNKIVLGGMVAVPVLLLVRFLFFRYATGAASIVIMVLVLLAAVCVLIGIVLNVSHDVANFNEGANANASGVAVLLEVAERIGQKGAAGTSQAGSFPVNARDGQGAGFAPVVHGEAAAYDAGVVPEHSELVYAASAAGAAAAAAAGASSDNQADRLYAAKAAIAALTGQPVDMTVEPIAEARAESGASDAAYAQEGDGQADYAATDAAGEADASQAQEDASADSIPAWFTAAKKKARKPENEGEVKIERSRFADAFDSAEAAALAARGESAGKEPVASPWGMQESQSEPEEDESPMAAQLRQMRESIQSVQAPQLSAEGEEGAQPVEGQRSDSTPQDATLATPATPASSVAGADVASANAAASAGAVAEAPASNGAYKLPIIAPIVTGPAESNAATSSGDGASGEQPAAADAAGAADAAAAAPSEGQDVAVEEEPQEQPRFVLPAESLIATPESFAAASAASARHAASSANIASPIAPIDGMSKQYAPLAAAAEGAPASPLSQLANIAPIGATGAIPSLSARSAGATAAPRMAHAAQVPVVPAVNAEPPSRNALLASLPSKSGILMPKGAVASSAADASVAAAAVPAPVVAPSAAPVAAPAVAPVVAPAMAPSPGGTASFAPVSMELAQSVDNQDDLFIDDAEDSVYANEFTASGAPAGESYMDMPKKRGLFGRRRKNKNHEEAQSAQEWLDVDEDFNAQDVGRERGGWESFRNRNADLASQQPAELGDTQYFDMESAMQAGPMDGAYAQAPAPASAPVPYPTQTPAAAPYQQNDDELDDFPSPAQWGSGWGKRWNGGAFSKLKQKAGRKKSNFDGELEGYADEIDFDDARYAEQLDEQYAEYGSAQSQYDAGMDASADSAFSDALASIGQQADLQSIVDFRGANLNTEVWFVALGSQLDSNAGIQAFLNEHKNDLRGAMIIELDALGAGELCVIDKEGVDRPVSNSSRMKRYIKKTSQDTGIHVGNANLLFANSASSYASEHGYQTLHLAGIAQGKQAHFAQADDVIENIREETLYENAAFVIGLLGNI